MIKRLLLLFLVFVMTQLSFSMHFTPDDLGRAVDKFGREARDVIAEIERDRAQRERNEKEEQERRLRNAQSEQERIEIQRQINANHERNAKMQDKWDDVGVGVANFVVDAHKAAIDIVVQEHQKETKLAQAALDAEARKEVAIENTKQYIAAFKDPEQAKRLLKTVLLLASGLAVIWHGSKILANEIQKYLHKIPTIAEETSLISYKEKMINYLLGRKFESDVNEVILEDKLTARVKEIADTVKNTVANGGFFQHLLFYGPPGTGKTMLAKRIARSSGLEYIYFAGGSSIEQLGTEEALIQLTELFEFAKRSPKKLMIIIDEAEVLLADRRKPLNDKTRKLVNTVLGYTGTEQCNFVVTALTNMPEDLDKAFLSRCDEEIELGVPSPTERLRILELYVNKFLLSRVKSQPKQSFFSRLFGQKPAAKGLSVEKDALSKDALAEISQKLDDFVGRDISKLVIAIQAKAFASPNGVITKKMIDQAVTQKIEKRLAEQKDFKKRMSN